MSNFRQLEYAKSKLAVAQYDLGMASKALKRCQGVAEHWQAEIARLGKSNRLCTKTSCANWHEKAVGNCGYGDPDYINHCQFYEGGDKGDK